MHIQYYLQLVHDSEHQLSNAFKKVADHHKEEPDIQNICMLLANWSEKHAEGLEVFLHRYEKSKKGEPERLIQSLFKEPRNGTMALLRDLHDLWLITKEIELCWKILLQAAGALHDAELETDCAEFNKQTKQQSDWLLTRIKHTAPQVLVASN